MTWPNWASPKVASGKSGSLVLVTLYDSARNSSLNRSVMSKRRNIEALMANRFGPYSMLRPTFPMVPAGASLHEMIRRPNNPLVETASEP